MSLINADVTGRISGNVVIPGQAVLSGARQLVLTGDQGSTASVTVHFREEEGDPRQERPLNEEVFPVGVQAVAQTFRLTESRFIRNVKVKFCAVPAFSPTGPVSPVWMQIRETQNGVPTSVVLGQKVLWQPYVSNTGYTTFTFDPPIPLLENIEYCFVLITADPAYTVAIAQIGHYVNAGDGPTPPYPGWVTQQPYSVGVLQVSSDVDTWTAMQDTDMVFSISGCLFSPTTKDVSLGEITAPDTTDGKIRAICHRPFGTADAHFELLHVPSSESHVDLENVPIRLSSRLNGDFRTIAHLEGDSHASPLLFPNTRTELGNLVDTADYITVVFPAGETFAITMVFDSFRAGGSIRPFVAVGDGGDAWHWQEITSQIGSTVLGSGWVEEIWTITGSLQGVGDDQVTRIKLTLAAGTPTQRPIVKNLRVITFDGGV